MSNNPILFTCLLLTTLHIPTYSQGFVARHNIPVARSLPAGYIRASQLANGDGSALSGPTRPLGQLPVAQDTGALSAPPKDPFGNSGQAAPKPNPDALRALIDSNQKLPGHFGDTGLVGPVGPVGSAVPTNPIGQVPMPVGPTIDSQTLQQLQPQVQPPPEPKVVFVPVPVPAPAPPATPPPPASGPSWWSHPLSGNLPWNG